MVVAGKVPPPGWVVLRSALIVTVTGSEIRADHARAARLKAASAGALDASPAPGTITMLKVPRLFVCGGASTRLAGLGVGFCSSTYGCWDGAAARAPPEKTPAQHATPATAALSFVDFIRMFPRPDHARSHDAGVRGTLVPEGTDFDLGLVPGPMGRRVGPASSAHPHRKR